MANTLLTQKRDARLLVLIACIAVPVVAAAVVAVRYAIRSTPRPTVGMYVVSTNADGRGCSGVRVAVAGEVGTTDRGGTVTLPAPASGIYDAEFLSRHGDTFTRQVDLSNPDTVVTIGVGAC
jgi:hypothetical protein